MSSENIKVFYRVFPSDEPSSPHVRIDKKSERICVRRLQELSKNYMGEKDRFWQFHTDGIFDNAPQEQLFDLAVRDLLPQVIRGQTAAVVAFGAVGTGKTFTVSGLQFAEKDFGLLPRIVAALLQLIHRQPSNLKTTLEISYAEFDRGTATDLLQSTPSAMEMSRVRELTKVPVSTEYEALKLLFQGEGRKSFDVSETSYSSNNLTSIITFHVTKRDSDLTNAVKTVAKLHVVDMAGIGTCMEPAPRKSPKDIGKANLATIQLEQLVRASNQNISRYAKPKYRMSAFLYYLGGDFDGSNLFRFIGHVTKRADSLLLTLSTLRFGASMKGMKSKRGRVRSDTNEDALVALLTEQVKLCRQDKYLDSVLLNHNLAGATDERLVDRTVENYLKGRTDEIAVMSVVDAKDLFKRLRALYNEQEIRVSRLMAEKEQLHPKSEVSLKVKGSRSSTNAPVGKAARKSKESVSTSDKKISEENVSEKRMRISNADSGAADNSSSYKTKRKSPPGSNSKQTASVRRRPSSTSVDKRDSRGSVKSNASCSLPLPQIVPERKELWRQFTEQGAYKATIDEYKRNENVLRTQYKTYLDEISTLNKNKDVVGKCFRDLVAAQTFRKFNKQDEFDKDGFLITSYAERSCQGYLETSRLQLLEQQERALLAQENLKAILDNRQQLAKKLNDDFDAYCLENTSLPPDTQLLDDDLKSLSVDVNFQHTQLDGALQFFDGIPKLPKREQMIKDLQAQMQRELKHSKFNENRKNGKWKNVSVNDNL